MALHLGLQYPPLAAVAVAALERWEGQHTALRVLAPQVAPLLEPYLRNLSTLEGIEAVPDAPGGALSLFAQRLSRKALTPALEHVVTQVAQLATGQLNMLGYPVV